MTGSLPVTRPAVPAGWRPIRAGTDRTVVVIDFGAGHAGAGMTDLAAALPEPWHVIGPMFGPSAATGPEELTAGWADALAAAGAAVHGVLAHCASAALAESLVASVSGSVPPPALVLIEPVVVTGAVLARRFGEVTAPLAEVLPPELIGGRQAWAAREAAAGGRSLATLAARFATEYRTLMTPAAEELGLDQETADGMADRTAAFLGYLALAGQAGAVLPPGHPLTVLGPAGHPTPERYRAGRHRAVGGPLRQLPSDLVAAVVTALDREPAA